MQSPEKPHSPLHTQLMCPLYPWLRHSEALYSLQNTLEKKVQNLQLSNIKIRNTSLPETSAVPQEKTCVISQSFGSDWDGSFWTWTCLSIVPVTPVLARAREERWRDYTVPTKCPRTAFSYYYHQYGRCPKDNRGCFVNLHGYSISSYCGGTRGDLGHAGQ